MAVFKSFMALIVLTVLLNELYGYSYEDLEKEEDEDEDDMHPNFKMANLGRSLQYATTAENTNEYWLNLGKKFVKQQKQQKQNINKAKNIILFLGDGMGLTTLVATRNYIKSEDTKLSFETFPYVGLSKTYSIDKIVSDSAATATAYLCGVKGNFGTVGVNGAILRSDCRGMKNSSNHVNSIAKWALDAGKEAGFITTTRITHASPAGLYAHAANNAWESNAELVKDCGVNHGLHDIAQQLIYGNVGSRLKVMMGGGKGPFIDTNLYSKGWRTDGRNLIDEYCQQTTQNVFIETKEELENVILNGTERLLGIFNDDHMDYHLETLANNANTQPSLEQMTRRAIEIMQKYADKGYFLFIEGGRIDMAHHDTKARLALDETKEFSKVVALARQMTSESDTLIVVTADHSATFSVAGYQNRGSNIFSLVKNGADQIPYEPLSYANGQGYSKHFDAKVNKRVNPQKVLKHDANDLFPATVPLNSETHSGEDVAVFASGPWSHLFTGVYEQNALPHMMAYAGCIGEGLKACDVS